MQQVKRYQLGDRSTGQAQPATGEARKRGLAPPGARRALPAACLQHPPVLVHLALQVLGRLGLLGAAAATPAAASRATPAPTPATTAAVTAAALLHAAAAGPAAAAAAALPVAASPAGQQREEGGSLSLKTAHKSRRRQTAWRPPADVAGDAASTDALAGSASRLDANPAPASSRPALEARTGAAHSQPWAERIWPDRGHQTLQSLTLAANGHQTAAVASDAAPHAFSPAPSSQASPAGPPGAAWLCTCCRHARLTVHLVHDRSS